MQAVPGYVLEERLGAGGSGEVWRARARSTGAAVAVKLIPAGSEDERAAVFAEAALLGGLDHPHLVRLHEVVPAGTHLALVLDLAGAGSLAELLAARGRLTPGEVVTALAPVGAALAHAHAAGVVHGDVSPGNILFTPIGFPLLSDLGLARLLGEVGGGRCTPAYADPLAAAGDVPIASSDVFALAAVAFHALTGETVWAGVTVDEVLATAAAGRLGDVAGALAAAGVPPAAAEIVVAGLAVDPAHRPTAAEFALDLRCSTEPIAVELDAGRARREGVQPAPAFTQGIRLPVPELHGRHRIAGRPVARRRWAWAAAAALLVVAVLGAWVGLRPGSAAPHRAAATRPAVSPAADPAQPESAAATLTRLDAERERAFAARDPALLRQVYASGDLLAADTATLARAVPAGCALLGVRNTYRNPTVTARDARRVVVRADVALQQSRLRCPNAPDVTVAGAPPVAMELTLLGVDAGYRIVAISPAPAPARTGHPRAAP